MNPEYKLLSKTSRPFHIDSEGATTIYIYDVAPDVYNFLLELDSFEHEGSFHEREYSPEVYEYSTLRRAVFDALGICEDCIADPDATFHKYELFLWGGCLILAEATAYNV